MTSAGPSLAESVGASPPPAELVRVETAPRARASGDEGHLGAGRLTLEERLTSVWEGLLAAGQAECPVCGGRMERSAAAVGCRDCGSRLS